MRDHTRRDLSRAWPDGFPAALQSAAHVHHIWRKVCTCRKAALCSRGVLLGRSAPAQAGCAQPTGRYPLTACAAAAHGSPPKAGRPQPAPLRRAAQQLRWALPARRGYGMGLIFAIGPERVFVAAQSTAWRRRPWRRHTTHSSRGAARSRRCPPRRSPTRPSRRASGCCSSCARTRRGRARAPPSRANMQGPGPCSVHCNLRGGRSSSSGALRSAAPALERRVLVVAELGMHALWRLRALCCGRAVAALAAAESLGLRLLCGTALLPGVGRKQRLLPSWSGAPSRRPRPARHSPHQGLTARARGGQVNGHFKAKLDPLGLDERPVPLELDPALYGFSDKDLDCERAPASGPRGFAQLRHGPWRQGREQGRETSCASTRCERAYVAPAHASTCALSSRTAHSRTPAASAPCLRGCKAGFGCAVTCSACGGPHWCGSHRNCRACARGRTVASASAVRTASWPRSRAGRAGHACGRPAARPGERARASDVYARPGSSWARGT